MNDDLDPVPLPVADVEADFPRIHAINLDQRLVHLSSGVVLPITDLLDSDGDATEDPEEAKGIVAGTEEFGWLSIEIGDWIPVTFH